MAKLSIVTKENNLIYQFYHWLRVNLVIHCIYIYIMKLIYWSQGQKSVITKPNLDLYKDMSYRLTFSSSDIDVS